MAEFTGMEWVHSDSAWIIAGFCAFIGLAISFYNIIQHVVHYTLPSQQLHIIRILLIVPVYAVVSWLSMMFIEISLYLEIIRDCYEAFVIYCFLILILGYVGGEANCVALISLKPSLKQPWPLCFLPTIPLNVRFLRFCKQSCIQFIIIKPIMSIINIIMLITGNYYDLLYQIFVSVVYNISYTLALYGLLLFYLACKDDIRAYSPVRKFMAIKIIVFATYWQGLFVTYAPGVPTHTAELWNDFVLCCEMSIFGILHLYSFPWWEFKTGMPSSRELISQNARKVLSFKDVVRDVYHNIAPAYQTYVLQTDDGSTKQYKTKTYMVGNLNDPSVHNKFMPNFTALRKKYGNGRGQVQFNKKNKYMLHSDESFEGTTDFDETDTHAHDGSSDSVHHQHPISILHEQDEDEENEEHENNEKRYKNDHEFELAIVNKQKHTNGKQKHCVDDNDDNDAGHGDQVQNAENVFNDFGDLKHISDITPTKSMSSKQSPDSQTNLIHNDNQNETTKNANNGKSNLAGYTTVVKQTSDSSISNKLDIQCKNEINDDSYNYSADDDELV